MIKQQHSRQREVNFKLKDSKLQTGRTVVFAIHIWKLLDLELAQNKELLFIIYIFALSTQFFEFTEAVCLKYRPSLVLLNF